MPELPEVQTVVNELNAAGVCGRQIINVRVYWPRIIAMPEAEQFKRQIHHQVIESIDRRGKFIVIRLHSGWFLLIHLRMTGHVVIANLKVTGHNPHRHVELELHDGRWLYYYDTRKFGRFYLIDNPDLILGRLGYEPLSPEFTKEILADGLQRHNRQLKPLLLDQGFIAGLGNIYVDEALFEAGLHPQRQASSLSPNEIVRLHRAIRKVLRQGIANFGTSLGNGRGNYTRANRKRGQNQAHLAVFHRTGEPCRKCGTPIQRIIVGQRSTHLCPSCQRL